MRKRLLTQFDMLFMLFCRANERDFPVLGGWYDSLSSILNFLSFSDVISYLECEFLQRSLKAVFDSYLV